MTYFGGPTEICSNLRESRLQVHRDLLQPERTEIVFFVAIADYRLMVL